ncbi:hypothetical protein BDP81DRAFT_112735 [Colletotrichum phormii]|uniref:Secreted protein n=1 Tax=Colletotrichum phormii TaxID=359342 RepID=A0AAJ0EC31_9PEZI|nr:uncharacterized protein BDP81DRAFT_112735 [Colletotrichum phormii]KAK1624242.1 hypothetical protein BDP81DRAFT_112735 [Colletotrichum phormii]
MLIPLLVLLSSFTFGEGRRHQVTSSRVGCCRFCWSRFVIFRGILSGLLWLAGKVPLTILWRRHGRRNDGSFFVWKCRYRRNRLEDVEGSLDLVLVVVVVVAGGDETAERRVEIGWGKERKQRSQQECSRQADAQQRVN